MLIGAVPLNGPVSGTAAVINSGRFPERGSRDLQRGPRRFSKDRRNIKEGFIIFMVVIKL